MPPVCIRCQVEFQCEKNAAIAVSMAAHGESEARRCDVWKCPSCGIEIAAGFGQKPCASHYVPAFGEWLAAAEADPNERMFRFWHSEREKMAARDLVAATGIAAADREEK